jgi:hypothetical protein
MALSGGASPPSYMGWPCIHVYTSCSQQQDRESLTCAVAPPSCCSAAWKSGSTICPSGELSSSPAWLVYSPAGKGGRSSSCLHECMAGMAGQAGRTGRRAALSGTRGERWGECRVLLGLCREKPQGSVALQRPSPAGPQHALAVVKLQNGKTGALGPYDAWLCSVLWLRLLTVRLARHRVLYAVPHAL